MGLLDGKRILVTGVLTDDSLAFAAARIAQEQGADIVLTGASVPPVAVHAGDALEAVFDGLGAVEVEFVQ